MWDELVVTGMSSAVLAGRYRLTERIGVGGMAEVYRGEDIALGRPVAVKMLHPAADAFGHARERLRSEVRVLARLSHPGLVPVYDTGEEAGRAFLVMQFVDGGTLADRLASGPIAPEDVQRIGSELVDVLAYLHGLDLVHRDLKPSNVLVASTGRILLADFGLARVLDGAHLTATNTTVGTAAYMAPEQVQGLPVGPPADIYALGLLLIECLSGAPVYRGGNPFDVAAARLRQQPRIPDVSPELPLAGFLEAMTRLDPDHRPTAEDLAARFQEVPAARAPTLGPEGTAVLPLVLPTGDRGSSSAQRLRETLVRLWRQLAAATPSRNAVVSSPAAERLRTLWLRRDTPTRFGLRVDAAVGFGLALVGLLLIVVLVASGNERPTGGDEHPAASTGPGTEPAPAAPAGPERLPADLDRLEEAVRPR